MRASNQVDVDGQEREEEVERVREKGYHGLLRVTADDATREIVML